MMRRETRTLLWLSALALLPAAFLFGGRIEPLPEGLEEDPVERAMQLRMGRAAARFRLPEPVAPPAEFSPFGGPVPGAILQGEAARGMLLTSHGHVDWDADRDAVAARIPPGLRLAAGEAHRTGRGTLKPGLNYVRLSEAEVAARGLDAVLAEVAGHARILGWLPERTLLVHVDPAHLGALGRLAAIDRDRALEPYHKVAPALGALPRLSRREAENPDLLARVRFVPGLGGERAIEALGRMPGVSEIAPDATDENGLQLRVRYDRVADLARRAEVLSMEPVPDFVLANVENVPTVQAGSAEDARLARPFDDAGVDGGGIDTNGDGRRLNDGTDLVPPQLVAITDNGISLDTPSFAQTLTGTIVAGIPIGGAHRKIHAIQPVTDSGTSCDAPLSGGSTHGNVVASIVAAYPSFLGVFANGSGIGGPTEPRNENMDGVARGARIIVQDAGATSQCTINSLVDRGGNVTPGSLLDRLNQAVTAGGTQVHLSVFPFGAPVNDSVFQFHSTNGTYPVESQQIDTFLYNNRDYMVFVPVGNNGGLVSTNRAGLYLRVIPDLFNGTAIDDPVADPKPIQVSPPSTAKNIVSVGAGTDDCFTFFGSTDCEQTIANFTSRGPATPQSLRMAPILTAPAFDLYGTPYTAGVAVFRSNDNDNLPPIDAQLDQGNYGTSYAAAYLTGAGAIIRDYFAQGFYPTGSRGAVADRMPGISGALVKAALAASADFNEGGIGTQGQDLNERNLRRTRCLDLGTVTGTGGATAQIGIMCNSEQGYGRAVLTNVLPLANWSDQFILHPTSLLHREYPAAGLLVWDHRSTGEAPIDNGANASKTHVFRVASPSTLATASGGIKVIAAQLRIALAWIDPPSPPGSGGPLINDLDLRMESPGPDSCLEPGDTRPDGSLCPAGSDADNVFYDGNDYAGGTNNANFDQWSKGRPAGQEVHEARNPIEAIHLNADPNMDFNFADSVLYAGRWRITVKRGLGGATPGSITIAPGPDPDEDDNNNGRLDPGEDDNGNGLLDSPGQAYALVVSGPVFAGEAPPAQGAQTFPQSHVDLDRVIYDCGADLRATIFDTTPGASAALSSAFATFTVVDASGAVRDTEIGIAFTSGTTGTTTSAPIPVRLAGPAIDGNGILEADDGVKVRARYAPPGQPAIEAEAPARCSPDLVWTGFRAQGGEAVTDQVSLQGGCDQDAFLDAGEVVSYGVALRNRSRDAGYANVMATLTPTGPGAAAVRVLDSPRDLGLMPVNGVNAVFFQVYVDPALANALAVANRVVTMRLDLDSSARGARISRQSYSFTHALNSDREQFRYSTDFIAGGRQVRDLNRNGVIDPVDRIDPVLGFMLPAEDATFSTLFSGSGAPLGHFTNEQGEDLDLNGVFTAGERNVVPNTDGAGNPILDRGILNSNTMADPNHRAPWNFDNNSGGWVPFRHPDSVPTAVSVNPLWEYKTNGQCGFQTSAGPNKFGIWHTGDGDPATPIGALPCDNHAQPHDALTPEKVELLFDVMESPIVAKVNQAADARGFPYTVEFQRMGFNLNIQFYDGYAGGGVNIDNDVDKDAPNSLLTQRMDSYYTRRTGGWPYGMFRFAGQYFPGVGIDPATTAPFQRTFGPFTNPNASVNLDGDETGFSGFTQDSNPASDSPIPTAIPDFLAYPVPNAPAIGVCDGGTQNDATCNPANGSDPCTVGGGVCTIAVNTVNGPVRNFDATLIGYEGGFASLIDVGPENYFFFLPGKAGNRWQIGIGFWAMESTTETTDYGVGFDDVVFEWNEWHPQDEAALGAPPACSRFGGAGQPAGGPCATLTVDRSSLYECEETIGITVHDAKCRSIGAGNTVPFAGACTTHAQCGNGGVCSAAFPSVQVQVVTDSDSVPGPAGGQVRFPNAKLYTLNAVAGSPGLFRGTVLFSTTTNDANHAYTNPGFDGFFSVYYHDPLCDGDRDGQAAEDSFDNVDGDGVADASDKCPGLYNPLQEDADDDGFGDLCDNCPAVANLDQADADTDGVGDACEFEDIDGDATPNDVDNCPDIRNPNQSDLENDGRGDLCDTLKTQGVTFGTSAGAADCVSGLCTRPGDAIGDTCVKDEDCIRSCNANVCTQGNSGTVGGQRCVTGLRVGIACADNATCGSCISGPTPGAPCAASADCGGGFGTCSTGICHNNFVAPTPAISAACNAHADCYRDTDREGDGVVDALDNCVIGDNGPTQGPNVQTDTDGDGLGNVCDGDCAGAVGVFRCRSNGNACQVPETNEAGVCSSGPVTGNPCNTNTNCGRCINGTNNGTACDSDAACTGGGTCSTGTCSLTVCRGTLGLGDVCGFYVGNAGSCSAVDDDGDADGVADLIDACPSSFNPAVVAGGPQPDRDSDGLGDACDPAGSFDDAGDGFPDDVVSFQGTIACRTQPLGTVAILGVTYLDLDGDLDPYPDTGERGRVAIEIRNLGQPLRDAVFALTSTDPNVGCITESQIRVPSLANNATIMLGSLDPGQPGFTFVASDTLQAPPAPAPIPTISFLLGIAAAGQLGTSAPIAFSLLADIDVPFGPQVFTLGPDGVNGTPDDGTIVEKFDLDRDGDGNITVNDTFLEATAPGVYRGTCSNAATTTCITAANCPADPPGAICYHGSYIRGDATGSAPGTVAATSCGGYDSYGGINDHCQLDPDFPMDWHLHCPPGATNCPNVESGTCVGGCSYNTPATNGTKAHSTPNSLHMGAHFDPNDALAGDTTHFRTLQGFMTAPVNLAIQTRPGDLDFSFYHIARLMDNNGFPANNNQCVDCGDVQYQIDQDPDPAVDLWGFWDKLVPYQNIYDHKPQAFSVFGSDYCLFTPTDTGTAPPNPRGVHETLCYPQGAWSHCGSTIGTTPFNTVNCTGPGEVDPSGMGVWVQTKFDLNPYKGQRMRVRWIAETWAFDQLSSSYWQIGGTWAATQQDDGWWLDDIRFTGTVTTQQTPVPDNTPKTGTCPGDPCDATQGDHGTAVVLNVADAVGNPIDGVTVIPASGTAIRVGAAGSSFPGGCSNGHAEYQFLRDGVVVQPWSGNPFFDDSPERTTRYTALVRCSSDLGCSSAAGASIDLPVRSGEGGDVVFGASGSSFDPGAGVLYYRGACSAGSVGAPCNVAADCGAGGACDATATTADDVTVLRIWSASDDGLDVVRGTVPGAPAQKGTLAGSFWTLPGLSGPCFLSNLPPTAAATGFNHASGPLTQAQDPNPAVGGILYYQAASNGPAGGSLDAYGCPSPAICSNPGWCELGTSPGAPCTTSGQCAGGGTCVTRTIFCSTDAGIAGSAGCGHHPTCSAGTVGKLCNAAPDCGMGGVCPAPSGAQQATEGQVCLNLTGASLGPAPYGNCPPAGHPRRVVSRAGPPACP